MKSALSQNVTAGKTLHWPDQDTRPSVLRSEPDQPHHHRPGALHPLRDLGVGRQQGGALQPAVRWSEGGDSRGGGEQ